MPLKNLHVILIAIIYNITLYNCMNKHRPEAKQYASIVNCETSTDIVCLISLTILFPSFDHYSNFQTPVWKLG